MAKAKIFKIVAAVVAVALLTLAGYGRAEFKRSFERGLAFYHDKNYTAAEVEFNRAVFWGRNSGMAHAWLGAAIIEQTAIYTPIRPRVERAFRHLDRAIKLGFDTHPIRFYRGLIFFNQGNWQAAKSDFEAALAIKPEGPGKYGLIHAYLAQMYSPRQNEAMKRYGASFYGIGGADIALAAEHARAATKEYLPQPYGWYLIAQVLGEAGAYREALDAVAQGVARGLDPASAAYIRADILMQAGRTQEALEAANQAIVAGPGEQVPGNRDRLRLRSVGFAHILRAEYRQALEVFDQYRVILREENRYPDALEAQARAFAEDRLR